jgi:hypothetical protein
VADLLTTDDLTPFAAIDSDKAEAMIADAIAMAALSAPCLASVDDLTPMQVAAAKAVLRAAVLRWNDAGTGAISTQAMGPFSVSLDTKQPRRQMFWPSEITDLQKICKGGSDGSAFSIDTAAPSPMLFHSVLCGWAGGVCTCGAIAFDSDDAGFV